MHVTSSLLGSFSYNQFAHVIYIMELTLSQILFLHNCAYTNQFINHNLLRSGRQTKVHSIKGGSYETQ